MTKEEFMNWWGIAVYKIDNLDSAAHAAWTDYIRKVEREHNVKIEYIRDVPADMYDEFVSVHALLFG